MRGARRGCCGRCAPRGCLHEPCVSLAARRAEVGGGFRLRARPDRGGGCRGASDDSGALSRARRDRRRGKGGAGSDLRGGDVGADFGDLEGSAIVIPIPLGCRVWIATGHTDMRRGMQGLALQVQEQLKRDPTPAISTFFGGAGAIWRRFSGTTALGFRSMRSGSTGASSSGRLRRAARCRSRRRRWPTCWKESTGEIRN